MTVTIAVDVMGGDHGAKVTVPATLSFLERHPDVRVILVGQQDIIAQSLNSQKINHHPQIEVHHQRSGGNG